MAIGGLCPLPPAAAAVPGRSCVANVCLLRFSCEPKRWRTARRMPVSGITAGGTRSLLRCGLVPGRLVLGREDRIQLAAPVGENPAGLCHLLLVAHLDDLDGGHRELADQVTQLDGVRAHAAGDVVPWGPDLLGVRVHVLASPIGQRVTPAAALGRLRLDQALVLQLLQGRVDRTWARLPHPAAALGDLLNYLIAVPRLLGQQRQGGGTDITALDPPGPVELGLPRPHAEPDWAEARRAERCLHRPAAPVPGPPAAAA